MFRFVYVPGTKLPLHCPLCFDVPLLQAFRARADTLKNRAPDMWFNRLCFYYCKIKLIYKVYYMLTKSQRSTEVNSTCFICPCTGVRSLDCRRTAMPHYDAFLSVRLRSLHVVVRPLCGGAETVLR